MADASTPALTARMDQRVMEVREVAKVLAAYQQRLLESGFGPEQTGELVAAFAEAYWENALHRCCPHEGEGVG